MGAVPPGALALTMLAWGSREEPTRVGAVLRGSHYAHLGAAGARASGRAEARPHARGSRDAHTELFGYVGASRRSCQFFISVGAPLGPDLGGGPNPLLPGNCLSTWESLWGPI